MQTPNGGRGGASGAGAGREWALALGEEAWGRTCGAGDQAALTATPPSPSPGPYEGGVWKLHVELPEVRPGAGG